LRKIETKNKALAFILGLVYGYRQANMELVVRDIKSFSKDLHGGDKIYYISREKGEVYDEFCEDVSHIYAIREDKESKKVILFVYKRLSHMP